MPPWSKLRAHDDRHDDLGAPPDRAPWVNDDEDAVRYELTESGPVALVDGDLEKFRDTESNPD